MNAGGVLERMSVLCHERVVYVNPKKINEQHNNLATMKEERKQIIMDPQITCKQVRGWGL